ncbi:MAG: prepilin-type N-terminal cleavage/methylation domain-containing protein [Bryobacteraceae bacterium]
MKPAANRGVTLIELLVVVMLISVMVGITFPSISSGLDSIRLASAADSVVSFINGALNRAERRQQVVEVTIDPAGNAILIRGAQANLDRRLDLPDGISIAGVLPPLPNDPTAAAPRSFFLYPGGAVPGFGIQLATRRGVQRIVSVDPITGVPQILAVPPPGAGA